MADDAIDPRETNDHPRRLPSIVGHEEQTARLSRAVGSSRMHHAWLFCGPRGIGKATVAYRLAAHLLAGGTGEAGLSVDHDSSAARWIASQSHPDIFVLERAFDRKNKKLKSEISVEDARNLLHFFARTAGTSGWRIAIVDPADDLNQSSANALLKIMEEPPANSLLLLVCHQPGKLLRTIRSRCSRLDFAPLPEADALRVVRQLDSVSGVADDGAVAAAVSLANGSPGLAMELLTSGGAKSFAAFQQLSVLSPQAFAEMGARFAGRSATVEEFEVFWSLLEGWLSERARQQALVGGGAQLAEAGQELARINELTSAFNLDRRHAVSKALQVVDRALKAG